MARAQLDPGYHTNPKVRHLSSQAVTLDIAGICHANEFHTDGHLSAAAVAELHESVRRPKSAASELVRAGRWHDAPSGCCPTPKGRGYVIHDFAEFSPTSSDRERERRRKRASRRTSDGSPSDVRADTTADVQTDTPASLAPSPPHPPNPTPTTPAKNRVRKRPADFEPSEANRKFAAENDLDLDAEVAQFCAFHDSKANKFVDWQAALRTWLGNHAKWRKERGEKSNVRSLPRTQQVSDFSKVSGEFQP